MNPSTKGMMFGLSSGFVLSDVFELELYAGALSGTLYIDKGWEVQEEGQVTQFDDDQGSFVVINTHLEPRIRLNIPNALSIDPYLLIGGFFRVYPPITLYDLTTVDYANQPGGLQYGIASGIGFSYRLSRYRISVEFPLIHVLSDNSYSSGGGLISTQPHYPTTTKILSLRLGTEVLF